MKIRRAIGVISAGALVALGLAVMAPNPNAYTPTTDYVGTWNDGFAEAQQDNCDQGFQPACDWVSNNN